MSMYIEDESTQGYIRDQIKSHTKSHDDNDIKETKLKYCPFCGGKATLRKSEETKLYHIACFECGCRQDSSYKAESVINAWNTRKPMDNIVAELDKAESVKTFGSLNSGNRLIPVKDAINIVKKGGIQAAEQEEGE